MNKLLLSVIITAVVVGGGAFYGGMKYSESNRQQFDANRMAGLRSDVPNERRGVNFISGEVIAKDEQSVTVKLPDGGSKIIFYSDTTEVGKFTSGTIYDLEIGKSVTVNGKTNSDGSITAQSIQISKSIPSQ